MAKKITADEFQELDKTGAILVDFYADWCGPCQQLLPIIDEVSEEIDIPIYKINVDEPSSKKMAMKHKVLSIPTLIMFKDGEPVANANFLPKDELLKFIEENK